MHVERLGNGPVIGPGSDPTIGSNIQGPSVIAAPVWLVDAPGRYLMYFADHKGSFIRLASADDPVGPWTIHRPGTLHLADSEFLTEPPEVSDERLAELSVIIAEQLGAELADVLGDLTTPHIASPDVHVDHARRRIVMYFHGLEALGWQVTRAALSSDGIDFNVLPAVIGGPYLRVFDVPHDPAHRYGLAMPGTFLRSADGLDDWTPGPTLFVPEMRHSAVVVRDDTLHVLWTRVGDAPESILHTPIALRDRSGPIDWTTWREGPTQRVLAPEHPWEGSDAPLEPSMRSAAPGHVNQLRDPAVLVDGERTLLYYAVAGESGIAVAEIHWD